MTEIMRAMKEQGVDVFGTSHIAAVPDRPYGLPYAITLGIRLSGAVIDSLKDGPTKNYFHHYRTVNAFLDACALRCVIMLQRKGYEAAAVPASQTTSEAGLKADFSHKTAANLAGLGFIGKSGLFITNDFGPRVRFATVLTDMALEGGQIGDSECGGCMECVRACPCGAITGREWEPGVPRGLIVDAALCSAHMKTKYKAIGRGAVCGICVSVCPKGKKSGRG